MEHNPSPTGGIELGSVLLTIAYYLISLIGSFTSGLAIFVGITALTYNIIRIYKELKNK